MVKMPTKPAHEQFSPPQKLLLRFCGKNSAVLYRFSNGNIKTGKGKKGIKTILGQKTKGNTEYSSHFFSLLYKLGIYSSGCCWVNRGDAKIVACLSGCKEYELCDRFTFPLGLLSRSFSTLTGETP
jgi:hypothetical protein